MIGKDCQQSLTIKNQKHRDMNVSVNDCCKIKQATKQDGKHSARKMMDLGSNINKATDQLCDLGQVIEIHELMFLCL